MIIGVSSLSGFDKKYIYKTNWAKKTNNTVFQSSSSKFMRNAGMAIFAATILSTVSSCNPFKKQSPNNDVKEVISKIESNDSMYTSIGEYHYQDNKIKRYYHYFPKDVISADNYNWSETIYPDGSIEKDSMEYQISITPDGKRTVIKTETDENGHLTVTKEFPDGTKVVRVDYKTDTPKEILYTETSFWANGNKKQHNYYNEYPININEPDGKKIIEQGEYKYNENQVLIMWKSNEIDSMRSESNNKYDKKGRLIYDDVKNEKYEYKNGAKNPFRIISEKDGCKRIKLFNSDGSIKREFFKAQDGTITEANAQ